MAATQVAPQDAADGAAPAGTPPIAEKRDTVVRGVKVQELTMWRSMTCSTATSDFDVVDLASPSGCGSVPATPSWAPSRVPHDVVASPTGEPLLLPVSAEFGDTPISVADLPEDTPVLIRVFRFFETRSDGSTRWERELQNVNSGSLLWAPVHMQPKMHSVSGAKYGNWFTVHHIEVLAKHFKSGYFMCEEGACPLAKTFGGTRGVSKLVTGQSLPEGYFWFVTPHRDVEDDPLARLGWRHVGMEGPFDGTAFLKEWKAGGSPTDAPGLQEMMNDFLSIEAVL